MIANLNPFTWLSLETWILLSTAIALVGFYCKKRLSLLKQLGIPHEDPGFMGLKFIRGLASNADYMIFEDDIRLRKKFGDIYGKYQFLSPIIVVWDPEILKQAMIKEFSSFSDRTKWMNKIQGEMNDSVSSVSGKQWKRIRSTLTPVFSSSKLKEMFYIVDERADLLVANLKKKIGGDDDGVFMPITYFGKFAMDVISSAAFSTNFNAQAEEEENRTIKLFKDAMTGDTFNQPIVVLSAMFPMLERVFEMLDWSMFTREFRNHLCSVVNSIIRVQSNASEGVRRTDLMQQMLNKKISESEAKTATKGLTHREIIGNSFIMLIAGYDTTTQSLNFLLYHLATSPDVQEKLREEIQASVERHEGKITYDTINDVKYLNQCINESLRMYPVAPLNMRICENDVNIKGVEIKKGTQVHIPAYGLAYAEDHWDEPKRFNPDRMEDMSRIDPMVFQPFGAGPRNCIGMRFALMTMKLAICRILTEFKVVTCDKTVPELELTITQTIAVKKDIYLKLEEL